MSRFLQRFCLPRENFIWTVVHVARLRGSMMFRLQGGKGGRLSEIHTFRGVNCYCAFSL